jgi:tetratricopeptide (TPR) repeat protein
MELGDYDVAEVAYRSALRDAGDPASKFRIKYEYVQGHYNTSRLSEALKPDGPIEACVASTYPIEALFGHYEKLLHAWSVDDTTAVASEVEYIESLLPVTQPRDDSRFERRRYDEAENLVRRVARAQSGDEAVAMILDEESTWFDFKTGNYKAIIDRLKPWKVKYPVSDYPTWDKETAFATLSVHSAYNRACCSFGLEEEAEQGFRSVIDTIPPNENRQLVASSHCWLGNILESRELYREALDQIEAGLEILPATSTYRDVYLTHHRAVSDLLRHFGGASR